MRINTKIEWREEARRMFELIIGSFLRNYINTSTVRIVITPDAPADYQNKTSYTKINALDREKKYCFFIRDVSNVKEICCYEERMSLKNHGKFIEIAEKIPINEVDVEKIECYCDAFIAFLMANIVWK